MSYEANYNTALTYIRAGLADRAYESLVKSLDAIEDSEKVRDNIIYLKVLTQLARISLERAKRDEAIKYIEQGLAVRSDFSDLLFLKSLFFWDEGHYDEMFGSIISYLVSLLSPDSRECGYEFAGEGSLKEVFETLIPTAYRETANHGEIAHLLKQLAEKTQNELIQKAYKLLLELDKEREAGHGQQD